MSNSAVALGESPRGAPTNDTSDSGSETDADGDGNPNEAGENDPTVVTVTPAPRIGLAKAAAVTSRGDGTFDVDFLFTVTNLGDVTLSSLRVTDFLTEFYAETNLSAGAIGLSPTDSGELSYNPGFDGVSDTDLLTGGDSLNVGESKTLTLRLSGVRPGSASSSLSNVAVATGTAPDGSTVSDESTDGSDPDPGRDGAANDATPTPVTFEDELALLLEKSVAAGSYTYGDLVTYTLTVTNPNAEAVTVTVTDVPAERLQYEAGSAEMTPDSTVPLAGKEPVANDGSLQWVGVVLAPKGSRDASDTVTIRYQMRVLPGAQSPLLNSAAAQGVGESGRAVAGAEVEAEVVLEQDVFEQTSSLITGRVYIDENFDGRYSEGADTPLPAARVVLGNGWQTLTDAQGNYAFRDVGSDTPGESWTVQLDKRTAPFKPRPHPEAVGEGYLHRVRVQGLSVSDFPLEPAPGLARAARSTTLRYGPVTLTKKLVDLPDGVRVVLNVTSPEPVPGLVITDPLPDGSAKTFRPDLTNGESLFSYDLPPGSPLTDPTVRRE